MAERRYQAVFYVAVIVGAMAAYGVYRVLEATKANSRIATAPVVVANQDMPEGTSVTRSSVSTKPWPVQTIPAGAYSSIDSVIGRVTRIQVFKGEPMLPGRMAPAGTGPGLEVKISPGKRAMAVRINDVAGISGLIQPNSRVDVLVTIRDDDASRARHVAKLFMENMRVLSVGPRVQRVEDDDKGPGASNATTATLEVTPDEAERLAVAMNQGTIQLVLRGYGDPDSIKTKGATSTDVLAQLREGRTVEVPTAPDPKPRRAPVERFKPQAEQPVVIAPPPPPPIRRPDSSTVQVYRAGKMSQQRFEKGDSTAKRGDSTSTSQTSSP
jgi:pilus assembly protein CpaB